MPGLGNRDQKVGVRPGCGHCVRTRPCQEASWFDSSPRLTKGLLGAVAPGLSAIRARPSLGVGVRAGRPADCSLCGLWGGSAGGDTPPCTLDVLLGRLRAAGLTWLFFCNLQFFFLI